jgi:tRNA A37 methylthiotransferase MiaB
LPSGAAALPARISGFLGHDRAFVKVQDGCQAFCSYCVVPLVRPRLWSKPADSVVEEVRALSEAGYGEVVLVGVHLGLYGSEAPEDTHDESRNPDLVGLIRRLLAETDVGRLRLSSVEPQEVTDDLIDLAVESDRVCPHFHLPLQSGDDSVLWAMNRRYTVREYLQTLERIARRIPRPAFTTDILLGFPGEGEAEFERTLSVVREARFSRIHAFRYSPRPGTKAARPPLACSRSVRGATRLHGWALSKAPAVPPACRRAPGRSLPGRPPEREVLRRERELLALAGELARAYRNQFLGEVVEVLVEGPADKMASPTRVSAKRAGGAVTAPPGAGGRQVMELKRQESLAGLSERYLRVRFPRLEGQYVRPGSLVKVRVVATDDAGLVGGREMKVGAGKK